MQYIVLTLLALVMAIGAQAWDVNQQVRGTAGTSIRTQASATLNQAQAIVATETTDLDADGQPEALTQFAAAFAPVGGGQLPASSGAPKADPWGSALGFCSWDHGSVASSANRISGANPGQPSSIVFALISAGPDKTFQTTCAQAAAGTVQGDDGMRTMTTYQLQQGVGGTRYWGDPVTNAAALTSLNTSTLPDGQYRVALDTGAGYIFKKSLGTWAQATASGGSGGGAGLQAPSYVGTQPVLANVSGNPVVAVGATATAIVDSEGFVWVVGLQSAPSIQEWGEPMEQRLSWTKLNTISGAKGVWYKNGELFVLKGDGTLWAAGANTSGQLGIGSTVNQPTFVQTKTNVSTLGISKVAPSQTWVLGRDGSLARTGTAVSSSSTYGSTGATRNTWGVERSAGVAAIAYGAGCAARVDTDGQLWFMGGATAGDGTHCSAAASTGVGTAWTVVMAGVSAAQISCTSQYACAQYIIKNDGTLWVKGQNPTGQLGNGNTTSQVNWQQATALGNSVALMMADASNFGCAFAVKADGTLWSTGTNTNGSLGLGDATARSSWTQVTGVSDVVGIYGYQCTRTVVAKSDGSLWAVGVNGSGQNATGTTTPAALYTWTRVL